ncbi:MAG: hypothetical protein Ta2E_13280 [Mycoplasmoidaceae bacterium]|nr:MAG: hypothetical protein Ta2E_13280 [Mycoplasmoidaceae bacterium]
MLWINNRKKEISGGKFVVAFYTNFEDIQGPIHDDVYSGKYNKSILKKDCLRFVAIILEKGVGAGGRMVVREIQKTFIAQRIFELYNVFGMSV